MSDDAQRSREALSEIAAEALRHLTWLRDAGVAEVPEPRVTAAPAATMTPTATPNSPPTSTSTPTSTATSTATPTSTASRAPTPGTRPAAPSPGSSSPPGYSLADKGCGSDALLAVRRDLGPCTRCKLAGGRTTLVFGVGDPHAELVFVGEGPGQDEDEQGEPFVGRAGQLLTRMIEAMGYRRDQVYIANVVKCRPPGNRNPEPDEIEACEPFLRAQIAAVGPKVIVALGKFAAQTLLRESTPISRLRGRWTAYQGVKLMPTFHPAYLLRSPDEKKKAWDDLQLVMRELGKPLPQR